MVTEVATEKTEDGTNTKDEKREESVVLRMLVRAEEEKEEGGEEGKKHWEELKVEKKKEEEEEEKEGEELKVKKKKKGEKEEKDGEELKVKKKNKEEEEKKLEENKEKKIKVVHIEDVYDDEGEETKEKQQFIMQRESDHDDNVEVNDGDGGGDGGGCDDGDDDEPEALDGGWAYIVLLATVVMMFSWGINSSCYSILYLDFLNEHQAPSSLIAAIFNAESFLWSASNLLGGALVEHFGWRSVAFFGGLLIAIGYIFSAFASSAPYLLFSHSLLTGLGSGLVSLTSYGIIPFYFKRLRGRANGIMSTGICIGGMLGPPAITYLQREYGYRGATLIVAAFMFNNCAAAGVFHPVTWHQNKKVQKTGETKTVLWNRSPEKQVEKRGTTSKVSTERNPKREIKDEFSTCISHDQEVFRYPEKGAENEPKYKSNIKGNITTANLKLDETCVLLQSKTVREIQYRTNADGDCEISKTESRISLELGNGASQTANHRIRSQKLSRSKKPSLKTTFIAVLKTLLRNIGVLRYATAVILSVGGSFIVAVCLNFMMMVPFAMEKDGYTQEQASWGLSLFNIFNLLSRVFITSLADVPCFSTRMLFIASSVGLMLTVIVFCFVEGVLWINIVLGVSGFMNGSCLSLYPLVLVEVMGIYKYMAMMGVTGFINGAWLISSGPLFGVIRDVSGSYTVTMLALTSTSLITIVLYLLIPAAVAYDKRRDIGQGKRWRKMEE